LAEKLEWRGPPPGRETFSYTDLITSDVFPFFVVDHKRRNEYSFLAHNETLRFVRHCAWLVPSVILTIVYRQRIAHINKWDLGLYTYAADVSSIHSLCSGTSPLLHMHLQLRLSASCRSTVAVIYLRCYSLVYGDPVTISLCLDGRCSCDNFLLWSLLVLSFALVTRGFQYS